MTPVFNSLYKFSCIVCASFLLVGCSYFDTSGHGDLEAGKDIEKVNLMEHGDGAHRNVRDVVFDATDGRVQIFSLDDGAPIPASSATPLEARASDEPITEMDLSTEPADLMPARDVAPVSTSLPGGNLLPPATDTYFQPTSRDPSVEIFPLDGGVPLSNVTYPAPVRQPIKPEEYAFAQPSSDKVVVYFAHDSAALNPQGFQKIAGVAQRFNTVANTAPLKVEGHASIRANYNSAAQKRIVNLKVSMDRAFAVSRALIEQGVPAEAIQVMAWGDTRPPVDLNGKSAESAARRVEISG